MKLNLFPDWELYKEILKYLRCFRSQHHTKSVSYFPASSLKMDFWHLFKAKYVYSLMKPEKQLRRVKRKGWVINKQTFKEL